MLPFLKIFILQAKVHLNHTIKNLRPPRLNSPLSQPAVSIDKSFFDFLCVSALSVNHFNTPQITHEKRLAILTSPYRIRYKRGDSYAESACYSTHESPSTVSRRGFRVYASEAFKCAYVAVVPVFPETLRYHNSTSGACKLILFVTRAAPSVIHRLHNEDYLLRASGF